MKRFFLFSLATAFLFTLGCDSNDPELEVGELIIEDTLVGNGPEAENGDFLVVDYVGTLEDGTIFDTSVNSVPFRFTLGEGEVIDGWDQGLVGMRVDGQRRLIIPPNLGYGVDGIPGRIPGNETITFDVRLIAVQGTISNLVWNDLNEDGLQSSDEPGLPSVTVTAFDCADESVAAIDTTDAQGLYKITGLNPGDYAVEFLPLAGYTFSPQNEGTNDNLDSDVDADGRTECITMAADTFLQNVDAGMHE